MIKKTIAELAKLINAEIKGDPNIEIHGIAVLSSAQKGDLSFLANLKYRQYLKTTKASVVILNEKFAPLCQTNALIVKNPHFAYSIIAQLFFKDIKKPSSIHPTAVIGQDCSIDSSVSIGAYVVIGDRITIGKNTQIDPNCVIGDDCEIGEDCHLWANVTLYYGVTLHNRVIIHSGSILGQDGLGYAQHGGQWQKVAQLGGVIIEDDVEMGANNAIDRGAINSTVIEKGVKMGNENIVGHNARIGAHTIMVGQVGIAGSTTIGKYCMVGGQTGFAGHIQIADQTILAAKSAVTHSIKKPGVYSSVLGTMPAKQWFRNVARLRHLDETIKYLKSTLNAPPDKGEL